MMRMSVLSVEGCIKKLLIVFLLYSITSYGMEAPEPEKNSASWYSAISNAAFELLPQSMKNKWNEGWNRNLLVGAHAGNVETIKTCLEHGAYVNTTLNYRCSGHVGHNRFGYTPLTFALCEDHYDAAKLLIEHGGREIGEARGCQRVFRRCNKKLAELLFESDLVDVHRPCFGHTLLHCVAEADIDCPTLARALIARGANVNVQDGLGNTPLHHAMEANLDAVYRVLLLYGADSSVKNWEDDITPLHEVLDWDASDLHHVKRPFMAPRDVLGLPKEQWGQFKERLFTLMCTLCSEQFKIPRDLKKLLLRYFVIAEGDSALLKTFSLAQLRFLKDNKLWSEPNLIAMLVNKHLAMLYGAFSTDDGTGTFKDYYVRDVQYYQPHRTIPLQLLDPDPDELQKHYGQYLPNVYKKALEKAKHYYEN